MSRAQKRGIRYGKYRAKKMKAKHVGGPEPEDAKKRRKIEIKIVEKVN